jgi:hypothetical protein
MDSLMSVGTEQAMSWYPPELMLSRKVKLELQLTLERA